MRPLEPTPVEPDAEFSLPSQKEYEFPQVNNASLLRDVLAAIGNMVVALAEIGINAAPFTHQLGQVDWKNIVKRLDALPVKSKEVMKLASTKGWFFGWDDSLETVLTLVEKLDVVSSSEIDAIFVTHYREKIEDLLGRLTQLYPERSAAIGAAVNAHKTLSVDGYLLAIPVFIAQADGLLTEITQVRSAFQTVKAKGTTERQASKALRELLVAEPDLRDLVQPLIDLHDLDLLSSSVKREKSVYQSGQAFTALNRHQVMHGESSDYGSEINSLKAFSFLTFVGLHLPLVLGQRKTMAD